MMCPRCGGEKVIKGYGCPGFQLITIPCHQCDGTGEVPEWQAEARRRGLKLVEQRRARDRSLREHARELRIPAERLSDIEHGRVKPEEWPQVLQEAAL